MTDSLRAKQNMEILDVWKDLNSQIVGRQNRQIQAYPESLLPKTQRDLGAEVNTDKSVENINRVLEVKLGALEFLVQQFASGAGIDPTSLTKKDVRPQAKQAEEQITNTGDIVPLWNSVVRLYQQQGLSRESQNIIKVKVQELTPNLEAMVYGMNQAIDYIFHERIINAPLMLMVMEFLRTLSVYTVIKQQVDSGQLELLSVEQLQRAYKNLLEEQSANRQALIKRYAPRGDITSTPIRNIPDFDVLGRRDRLKAIADELGIDPRVFAGADVGNMSGTQFAKFIEDVKDKKVKYQAGYNRQEQALLQEAEQKQGQIQALRIQNDESRYKKEQNALLIRQLEEEAPLALAEVERQTLEVPEEPILPDEPNREEYPAGEEGDTAYEDAMETYGMMLNASVFARNERSAIIEHNAGLLERLETSQAKRKQSILDRQRLMRGNDTAIARRQAQIDAIQATLPALERRGRELDEALSRSIQSVFSAYNRIPLSKSMRRENVEASDMILRAEARRRAGPVAPLPRPGVAPSAPRAVVVDDEKAGDPVAGEGKGRRAETRGLATLRKNYGFESMSDTDDSDSESDSDEDRPFDFDDAGNDMYYSKPMRK